MSDFEFDKPAETKFKGTKKAVINKQRPPAEEPKESEVEAVEAKDEDKPRWSEEELLALFDEIIFSGGYEEEVTIKGRLRVAFRTRTAGENKSISQIVDSTQANLIVTLEQARLLANLQYALVSYQGKDLRGAKPEDRLKFIENLPSPIISAIAMALSDFDTKVYEACKVGEENF